MKRIYIAATAVWAGAISFLLGHESSECKESPCAVQRTVTMPEPPHPLEELPGFEAPEGMVALNTSPITFERRERAGG